MMRKIAITVAMLFLMVIWIGSNQTVIKITGYMGGQILDNDEKTPVVGARITVHHVSTGNEFSDVSDKNGTYLVKDMVPGLYNVSILFSQKDYKYMGQILAEAKRKFYIKACWATKHEKLNAKLLDKECKSREPIAWWKQKKFLIIGGAAAAAAGAAYAIHQNQEEEASPATP